MSETPQTPQPQQTPQSATATADADEPSATPPEMEEAARAGRALPLVMSAPRGRKKPPPHLADLDPAGRKALLEDRQLYTKYLLRAGSLESKSRTGAADINKFYGKLATNFLRNGS